MSWGITVAHLCLLHAVYRAKEKQVGRSLVGAVGDAMTRGRRERWFKNASLHDPADHVLSRRIIHYIPSPPSFAVTVSVCSTRWTPDDWRRRALVA